MGAVFPQVACTKTKLNELNACSTCTIHLEFLTSDAGLVGFTGSPEPKFSTLGSPNSRRRLLVSSGRPFQRHPRPFQRQQQLLEVWEAGKGEGQEWTFQKEFQGMPTPEKMNPGFLFEYGGVLGFSGDSSLLERTTPIYINRGFFIRS